MFSARLRRQTLRIAVTTGAVAAAPVIAAPVAGHDYDGTTRDERRYDDYSHNGVAACWGQQNMNAYPYQIYALSMELCKTKSNGSTSCRSRKYTYR